MAEGFLLDRSAVRRMGAQTRKGELRPTDLREDERDRTLSPQSTARFKLLTPLEVGKSGTGRRMSKEPTDDEGGHEWVPTDHEEPLHATPGIFNHLPAGAQVTAELTSSGWRVRMDELWCMLPGGIEPFPYMVLRLDRVTVAHYRDAIQLQVPVGGIDDDYVFTTAFAPDSLSDDVLPGETPRPRMVACTPMLPAKAAYKPFDLKFPNGDPIPDSILQALDQGAHPSQGELWGPGSEAKLTRSITVLEIFWWEVCAPEWECVPGQVPNPQYDPDSNFCNPFHQDYDPDNIVCQPTIDGDVWGIVCDGQVVVRAASGFTGANIPCTEDPPETRSGFFRSPIGWWGLGGWTWNWFWGVGWWRYGFGWWNTAVYWNDSWWWGPFGINWWLNHWGGRPPTPDDLLALEQETVPEPPCGGGVLKRSRYGFVVWESGWRVLGADAENEVATIAGCCRPEFKRPFIVVENPDPPEPVCGQYY